jgi:F-type H+-transporting ATPase subunit b
MLMSIFAAEGPNGMFFPSDMKEFWWSTAAFLVVLSLILWKLLPLIKKGMADRSDRIRAELVEAERARVEAEAELSNLKTKLGDADAESQRIISGAHEQAVTMKAELIARADGEAADARAKAEAEISTSQGQVTADIQAAVASQAAEAAESVVRANLDQSTHADLIDRYIQEVSSS